MGDPAVTVMLVAIPLAALVVWWMGADTRVVRLDAAAFKDASPAATERWIREHLTEVGREEFPDNPGVTWSLKGLQHQSDLWLAEVVPEPDEVGYPRFVFGFAAGRGAPRHVATWCFQEGGFQLLATGPGAPPDLPRRL
jgi:hypothetical protein